MNFSIEKTPRPKQKPDENNLGFGQFFTDHMFIMPYDKGRGWHSGKIVPYAPFSMDPACMAFHYGQECFEGLKAYAGKDGRVRLFRPDKNAQRMTSTHERLCMPPLPQEDFLQAVRALVAQDKAWVPTAPGTSLYVRPCTVATEPRLGVKASDSYLFFVILTPSGSYYAEGLNPVKIYVEDELTRAAPGGTGAIKCGGNYAASMIAQEKAHRMGYSQVLWLDGVERKFVEEVGSMNCFFVIDGLVYTAPTGQGTILPGITRMSCIELLQSWGYTVAEKAPAIDEVMNAAAQGKLTEVFGTGTAAVISSVGRLFYKGQEVQVGSGGIGQITQRLYDTITGIQYGNIPDSHGWMQDVE